MVDHRLDAALAKATRLDADPKDTLRRAELAYKAACAMLEGARRRYSNGGMSTSDLRSYQNEVSATLKILTDLRNAKLDEAVARLDNSRSHKMHKARREAHKNAGGSYVKLLKEGEAAKRAGKPKASNPYTGEDAEIWEEGYDDV